MARVRFIADYDYRPTGAGNALLAYKAGKSYTVKRECAAIAVLLGKAVDVDVPPRPQGRFNYADEHKFDHDGDGAAGGSRRGRRRRVAE